MEFDSVGTKNEVMSFSGNGTGDHHSKRNKLDAENNPRIFLSFVETKILYKAICLPIYMHTYIHTWVIMYIYIHAYIVITCIHIHTYTHR